MMVGNTKYTLDLCQCKKRRASDPNKYVLKCSWSGNSSRRRYPLTLPSILIKLFEEEYFDPDDLTMEDVRSLQILGFTEYRKNGKQYRSHPDFQGKGPWYDFVVIPWQEKPIIEKERKAGQKPKPSDPSSKSSYLDDIYPGKGKLVPARLLALFKDPLNGDEMAIVHSCRPRRVMNEKMTSVLTESWHLYSRREYIEYKDKNNVVRKENRYVPLYHMIKADLIQDGVRVYLEDYRLLEHWPLFNSSGHAILLTSRSLYWANDFLSHTD